MGSMAFVAVNVLTVPEGAGATLEQRFARRAGSVEKAPGFEHFELLRPLGGTDSYLVYTRWATRAAFEEWTRSQSFAAGHGQASGQMREAVRISERESCCPGSPNLSTHRSIRSPKEV